MAVRRARDRRWAFARGLTMFGDVVAVIAAVGLATVLRYGADPSLRAGGEIAGAPAVAAVALVFVALLLVHGLYASDALLGGHRVYTRIGSAAAHTLVGVIAISYFLGGPPVVSRGWLLFFLVFTVVLVSVNRYVVRRVIWHLRKRGWFVRRVVIAGANRSGVELAQQLNAPLRHGCEVVGFADDYLPMGTEAVAGLVVEGHTRDLDHLVHRLHADEVIVVPQALTWETLRDLVERSAREPLPYDLQLAPTSYDLVTSGLEIAHRAYVPLVTLRVARISRTYMVVKNAVEFAFAAIVLLAALPLSGFALARARMRREPVFSGQPVFGRGGARTRMLSFHPSLGLPPALQRVPALLNVLSGELSLVGPRPIGLDEAARAGSWRSQVAGMKPGLLGLWRLRTDITSLEELARLDLYYVRNYTIVLDLQVILETTVRMLRASREDARRRLHRWEVEAPPSPSPSPNPSPSPSPSQ